MDVVRCTGEFVVADIKTGEAYTLIEFRHQRRAYLDGEVRTLPDRFTYIRSPGRSYVVRSPDGTFIDTRTGMRLRRLLTAVGVDDRDNAWPSSYGAEHPSRDRST